MSDLIDRQAAIDALAKELKGVFVEYRDIAEKLIGKLPSAQPDNRLSKISDLVEGTIDHFDLDDAMDLLYQIKDVLEDELPSAQPQLEDCPIYGGMCGYPSNLCYECPRHEGAKERPQWWTEGLQPFAQPQPCKDAVSKADVLETYAELYDIFDDNKEIKNELHKIYDKINALKAAQPQRMKGRWKLLPGRDDEHIRYLHCSVCHFNGDYESNFCPNCGADMRGE